MRYFIDTEFIEDGPRKPITLISIGIAAADGREYYAISSTFSPDDANGWVRENVLPHLGDSPRKPLRDIACDILDFISADRDWSNGVAPEFWGYYADYDWVVFCQIFGRMIDLPRGWPMYCHDLKQLADELGNPRLPEQESAEHNALNDARWNRDIYNWLQSRPCPHTWNDGLKAWGCVLPLGHRGEHKEYVNI